MTPAVISILTGGLTCGETTACQGGSVITSRFFSVWCVIPIEPINKDGGSHATPNALTPSSAIARSDDVARPQPATVEYPNSDQALVHLDPNQVMGKRVPVTLQFKMGEYKVEKIYSVSTSKASIIINVSNITSNYKKKLVATIANFKKIPSKIKMVFRHGKSYKKSKWDQDQ